MSALALANHVNEQIPLQVRTMVDPLPPKTLEGEVALENNNIGWISYTDRILAIGYKREQYEIFLKHLEAAVREVFPGYPYNDGGFAGNGTNYRLSVQVVLDEPLLAKFLDKLVEKKLVNEDERKKLFQGFGEQAPNKWRVLVSQPKDSGVRRAH